MKPSKLQTVESEVEAVESVTDIAGDIDNAEVVDADTVETIGKIGDRPRFY